MRVAVLSDIHSNYPALEAVFNDARGKVDDYWCLGDVIGYGLNPVETLQAVVDKVSPGNTVKGNHEAVCLSETLPISVKFGNEGLLMMQHNRQVIQDSMCGHLLQFAQEAKKQHNGVGFYLVHSLKDIFTYLYYWNDPNVQDVGTSIKKMEFPKFKPGLFTTKECNIRIVLIGHSHLPGIIYLDPDTNHFDKIPVRNGVYSRVQHCNASNLIIINPGSVGFSRDYIPLPSYLILDTKKLTFEFRRPSNAHLDAYLSGYDEVKRNVSKYLDGTGMNIVDAENYILGLRIAVKEAKFPKDVYGLPEFWRKFYLESKKHTSD